MKTDILTTTDLRSLMERREANSVSMYLPTHPGTPEAREDPIRFKNLLSDAEERLLANGIRASEAKVFLQQAHEVLRDLLFWEQQAQGLAIFLSPTQWRLFRLPLKVKELVTVSQGFHIKPLLPLLMEGGRFYVLSLGLNGVRLYDCTRVSISEVALPGIPLGMAEVLKMVESAAMQTATGVRETRSAGKSAPPSHGMEEEDRGAGVREYFNEVDKGVRAALRDQRPPMVLAGAAYLFPFYREAAQYPNIWAEGIEGSADNFSPGELRERAWQLVEPQFRQVRQTALDHYHQLQKTGRTSHRIEEILPAAIQGRISRLFIVPDQHVWGNYDADTGEVLALHDKFAADDVDLLDAAAVETLLRKGEVFALPLDQAPDGTPHAAMFRR